MPMLCLCLLSACLLSKVSGLRVCGQLYKRLDESRTIMGELDDRDRKALTGHR